MKSIFLSLLVLMLVRAAPAVSVSPDSDELSADDWLIERFDAEHELPENRAVAIRNEFGNIRTRGTDESIVSVHAVIQRHLKDKNTPEVSIRQEGGRLLVTVNYPDRPVSEGVPPDALQKRRVDVAVFVPSGMPLEITTNAGLAESKGHKDSLLMRTQTGKINIVTSGSVSARSEHGEIFAVFRNREWSHASDFQTQTGKIGIRLMESPDVAVTVDTAGNITTDYSMDIQQFPGTRRKAARASIGAATQSLSLTSLNGDVAVGRVFDMIPAAESHLPATEPERD